MFFCVSHSEISVFFDRSEKSEVLTDELQLLERQVNQIRDAWQSIVKKLQACFATHTGEADKRLVGHSLHFSLLPVV